MVFGQIACRRIRHRNLRVRVFRDELSHGIDENSRLRNSLGVPGDLLDAFSLAVIKLSPDRLACGVLYLVLFVLAVEDDGSVVAVGGQISVFVVAKVLIGGNEPVRRRIDRRRRECLNHANRWIQCRAVAVPIS